MDHAQALIDQALAKLREVEAAIAPLRAQEVELRHTVNGICKLAGRDPMFENIETEVKNSFSQNSSAPSPALSRLRNLPPDFFVGKALATAVRLILEMRKEGSGSTSPATIDEIYEVLVRGGYEFPGSKDPDLQKRALAISLAKNTTTFRRLQSGLIGLVEWYGRPTRIRRNAEQEISEPFDESIEENGAEVRQLEYRGEGE